VGARVVVREDRRAQVRGGAGGAQIAAGGEDRVGGVVGVLEAVAVGIDAVDGPRRWQELHPSLGTGARDAEVAPVVGLDLVDRREHLPGDAVGGSGGLKQRQQERGDAKAFDEERRYSRQRGRERERQRRRERRRRRRGRSLGGGWGLRLGAPTA